MPSIKDKSTVEAIARAFTSNGRNGEQALLSVGYSKAYARGGTSNKLYSNVLVKAAIARIDEKSAVKQERTVESLDAMYQAGFDIAQTQKNPAAMATNATGIARLYGMDKDNDVGKGDKPVAITPEQAERYGRMADAAVAEQISGCVVKPDPLDIITLTNAEQVAGPKLSKEA